MKDGGIFGSDCGDEGRITEQRNSRKLFVKDEGKKKKGIMETKGV